MRADLKPKYRNYPYWRLAGEALLASLYVFPWAMLCGAYRGAMDGAAEVYDSLRIILDIRHEDRRKRDAERWAAFNEECRSNQQED